MTPRTTILAGDVLGVLDVLADLPDDHFHCAITSPPYWSLRDYGVSDQLGLESRLDCLGWATGAPCGACYVCKMVAAFRAVWRVLRADGIAWLNMGDCYAGGSKGSGGRSDIQDSNAGSRVDTSPVSSGLKPKDLCLVPSRVALALQSDGWWVRSMVPWVKANPLPESCTDRPTSALENVFMLSKSRRYCFDMGGVRKPHQSRARHCVSDNRAVSKYGVDGKKIDARRRGTALSNAYAGGPPGNPGGRAYRNTDLYFESIARPHGAIFAGSELVGLYVNPQRFVGAFCTACKAYYHRGNGSLPKHVEVLGDGTKARHPICACGRWDRWLSHFATFPERLVLPLVKMGTSEKGCCRKCGRAWVRVIAERKMPRVDPSDIDRFGNGEAGVHRKVGSKYQKWLDKNPPRTVGWRPACDCDAGDPVPCRVLDPFCGSGTTGVVAGQLGRDFVGIDINPDYASMAQKRIAIALRPNTARVDRGDGEGGLFGAV